MNLPQSIRSRRESLNLTQQQLADMLGVKQPYIADIEAGRKSPSIKTLEPFVTALGGTIEVKWKS